MYAILTKLQIDNGLVSTLNSFHLIQAAVRKEECDGYRSSVPVIAC